MAVSGSFLTQGEQNEAALLVKEFLRTRTYRQLAGDLGIYPQTVHQWIRGTRKPGRETLALLRRLADKELAPGDWRKIWNKRNLPGRIELVTHTN